LNERLNQAERLVNLGRMVATVSHEIRNPLGIINSSADYLSRRLEGDPKLVRLAGAIVDESTRLSRIVTDFLDFARPQKPRMAPTLVEDILEEILVLLEIDMSRAGVELRTRLREDPGFILADASLLYRAFMNILVNAIQAMPEGGLLTVETALVEGEEGKSAPGSNALGMLRVRVTDTGPGIGVDAAESLFKPFFTTKTKGTGLGLVLVRNIVEGHGGRFVLRNIEEGEEEGHGLEVTMILPLDAREGVEPGGPEGS
jgi:signal transduction histidine kinase